MACSMYLIPVAALVLLLSAMQAGHCHLLRNSRHNGAVAKTENITNTTAENCTQLSNGTDPVSVLFVSSADGNMTAVHCLIAAGVNVSGNVNGGFTALNAAVTGNRLEIARTLIAAGAFVNVHDSIVGITPLHSAAAKNFVDMAKLLIDSGADPNAKTILNITPLQMAITKKHKEVVATLIEKGASVNETDNFGNTALHTAAYRGYFELVKLLVQKGANIQARNNFGQTPADVARDHQEIRDWLNSLLS